MADKISSGLRFSKQNVTFTSVGYNQYSKDTPYPIFKAVSPNVRITGYDKYYKIYDSSSGSDKIITSQTYTTECVLIVTGG